MQIRETLISATTVLVLATQTAPATTINVSNDPGVKILKFIPDGKWHMVVLSPDVLNGKVPDDVGNFTVILDGVGQDTKNDCIKYEEANRPALGGAGAQLTCVFIP